MGVDHERRHFDGWTPITLALHLHSESDWHGLTVHEPWVYKLARYSLQELEELHALSHRALVSDLEPRTDGRYERAIEMISELRD